jgi:hypothetical protein
MADWPTCGFLHGMAPLLLVSVYFDDVSSGLILFPQQKHSKHAC